MQKLKYQNKHFNYILTVIDCFSKYAWAIPIKSKSANDTYEAIKKRIDYYINLVLKSVRVMIT